jgi:hypothetical protein
MVERTLVFVGFPGHHGKNKAFMAIVPLAAETDLF